MKISKKLAYTLVLVIFLCAPFFLHASFGITPPYVKNTSLTRNSEFTQKITLVRGDPVSDLKAELTMDVPGANDWITIDKGMTFLLPKGEQKVPMYVTVKIPDGARFQKYKGNIRIRTSPADGERSGGGAVSIALGAQIDVDFDVIDRKIFDFRVRKIAIEDVAEGHSLAWLYFPGKINFKISLENTGNIDVAPSKVVFDIFDFNGETLLETTESKNKIEKVKPFETKEVVAELPTSLPAGSYLVRYVIYNNDEVKQEGELNLSIVPYGTLAQAGYGFSGLSIPHKLTIIVPIAVLLLFVFLVFKKSRKRKR
ncbi:MAG: hypothetical protein WDZ88_02960 [Candidatus Paceibacterota bacterium]